MNVLLLLDFVHRHAISC